MTQFGAVHDEGRGRDPPVMTSAPRVCRKCGSEIFADAPEGLCTACLFQTGLDLLTDNPVAGVGLSAVASAKADDLGPLGAPLQERRKKSDRTKTFGDFGDYELVEVIGRGGQGVVYRARQKSLNRTVALKVIGLGHWASDAHLKRFRREAEAAASLDYPGIVPIYEVGERDGSCYFSMKLVEGGQLDAVVKSATADSSRGEREPMPIRQAVELIAKVARTVHYAHEHGILHRDIKPGNILLDRKGEPHLTDFGLARLIETESTVTRTMEVLGTPSYMAPEQAVGNNDAISSATDVYGLGAVLYQLLTGQPPFAGGTTYETIKLLLDTEPRQLRLLNPKIDRDLSTICLKCIEKDPKRRYSSALALAEDLERWLKHEPILARRIGPFTRGVKWVRRNPTSALLAASLVALAAAAGWILSKSELIQHPLTTGIAVLPFENLSDEKENAFFADGVQDDILIKLAKIAGLKVISRSSVMQYRGKQDVRQIGNALRVSHVLEGTVRRFGGKVHINAQLVDTGTDTGIWAEEYDRDLNDVFAIETEVAQSIANRLRAKVSAREKAAMQEWPTKDLIAYDLYVRAKNILAAPNATQEELLQAVDLLNQAVARDPSFFDAYCQLAYAHDNLYNSYVDHTSARLALAKASIQTAARLRPDAGETHLARARNLYWGYWDYDGALAELKIARSTLPNDFRIPQMTAQIQRRQGHWEESTRNLEYAIELNPHSMETRVEIAMHYTSLRRYAELKSALASTSAVFQDDVDTRIWPAYVEFQAKADTWPLHQMLDLIRATNPPAMQGNYEWWLACALAERDATAANNALGAHDEDRITLGNEVFFSRSFVEGLIALLRKEEGKAQSAFVAARAQQEKVLEHQPHNGRELGLLGLIDAYLGRKEDALREGRRAVELVRAEKDVMQGIGLVPNLAMIAAWVGDKDLACEQLASIIRLPNALSYGGLKLFPWWDPLRGDPRFEKILQEVKQPVTLK
jgi:serine/threonine protein kinase/tetratricopeptide (TPR) repeat protein